MTSTKNTSEISSVAQLDSLACVMHVQQQRGARVAADKAERQEFSYLICGKKEHTPVPMVIMTFRSNMDGPTMPFVRVIGANGDKGFNVPGITASFDIDSQTSEMFLRWNAIHKAAWVFMKWGRCYLPETALTYTARVVKLAPPRGSKEPIDALEVMVVTSNKGVVSYIDYTDVANGYISTDELDALGSVECAEKANIMIAKTVTGQEIYIFANFKHKPSHAENGGTIMYQEFNLTGPSKEALRQAGIQHPGWRKKGEKPTPEQLSIGNYGLCIQESNAIEDENGDITYVPNPGTNWIRNTRSCIPNVSPKDHNVFVGQASIYMTMITSSNDLKTQSIKYDGRVMKLPIEPKRFRNAPELEGAYDLTPMTAHEEVLKPIGKAMAAQSEQQEKVAARTGGRSTARTGETNEL